MPTKTEYDAAKARQLKNEPAFRSRTPAPDVLADVATIRAYEQTQG